MVPALIEEGMGRAEAFVEAHDRCMVPLDDEPEQRAHEHSDGHGFEIKQEQQEAVDRKLNIIDENEEFWIDFFEEEFAQQIEDVKEAINDSLNLKQEAERGELEDLEEEAAAVAALALQRIKDNAPTGKIVAQIESSVASARIELEGIDTIDDVPDDLLEAQRLADELTDEFAQKISDTTEGIVREEVRRLREQDASVDEVARSIENRIDHWDKSRARMVARTEAAKTTNRAAEKAYQAAGITKKQWVARADACPYCASLNGEIVDIDRNFINAEEEFQPEGANSPLHLGVGAIEHPPAHPNCRCMIVPV